MMCFETFVLGAVHKALSKSYTPPIPILKGWRSYAIRPFHSFPAHFNHPGKAPTVSTPRASGLVEGGSPRLWRVKQLPENQAILCPVKRVDSKSYQFHTNSVND